MGEKADRQTDMNSYLSDRENGKDKKGKMIIVCWTVIAPGECTCKK